MIPGYEKIVEEKIRAAQKRGAFDRLAGSGQPLPEEDIRVPEDLRMAYRLLKTADFLPPEIELRKEIHATRELLDQTGDLAQQQKLLQKLNVLIRKCNMMRTGSIDRELPEEYVPAIVDRLAGTDETDS